MGQLTVDGAITGGPAAASADGSFSATFNARLKLTETPKSFVAGTGAISMGLASPGSFVTLPGLGTNQPVAHGTTLYLHSTDAIDIRITTDDGAGNPVVATWPLIGLVVLEFQETKFLRLLEAKGTASIEYLVTGPQ